MVVALTRTCKRKWSKITGKITDPESLSFEFYQLSVGTVAPESESKE